MAYRITDCEVIWKHWASDMSMGFNHQPNQIRKVIKTHKASAPIRVVTIIATTIIAKIINIAFPALDIILPP